MKKYFYLGIAIILLMAMAMVGYGAWLNYSDENQIAQRMDNRVLQLKGAKAAVREMRPVLTIDAVRFASNNMTDAVALTNGRILQWYVGKNSTVSKGDILLSMDNEQIPLKIQETTSAVRKAEAALAQAYSAYQRQGRLMAKNATSQEKYEASEAQYLAAIGRIIRDTIKSNEGTPPLMWSEMKKCIQGALVDAGYSADALEEYEKKNGINYKLRYESDPGIDVMNGKTYKED